LIVVVMGVAGSGKTTVAACLAARLDWPMLEGDTLHPPANVAKMAGGTPLTDADRAPWLAAIAAVIDTWRAAGISGVVACSALKRAYRDVLIGARDDVRLVFLRGDRAAIEPRLAARQGHFMPPALLASQFATLEEPGADERPLVVDVAATPEAAVKAILGGLAACGFTYAGG
jgi:gluconokinase